jgi:hypothetical protein
MEHICGSEIGARPLKSSRLAHRALVKAVPLWVNIIRTRLPAIDQ